MAEKKPLLVYAAAYETVEAALADLDAIEQAHKDEVIGQYDAAVIDKEDGKPHVVKRMDRPHIRVIPEWFPAAGLCPARSSMRRLSSSLPTRQGSSRSVSRPSKRAGQGADQGRQGREAHRGGHDRRNRQRAAGSAQELTLPQQSKAALSGAGFLAEVAQHRRLKTVGTRGFSGWRRIPIGAGPCWLRAPIPPALRSGWVAWEGQAR